MKFLSTIGKEYSFFSPLSSLILQYVDKFGELSTILKIFMASEKDFHVLSLLYRQELITLFFFPSLFNRMYRKVRSPAGVD